MILGTGSENGYDFKCFLSKDGENWITEIRKGEEVVKTGKVRVGYAPRFGPDVADVAACEKLLDELLKELSE